LVDAILFEQNDEWAVPRARYMTLETIAPMRNRRTASSFRTSFRGPAAPAAKRAP
jgi:hypothetical protein